MCSSFALSLSSIRDTGIPVQLLSTSAICSAVTSSCTSPFPLECRSDRDFSALANWSASFLQIAIPNTRLLFPNLRYAGLHPVQRFSPRSLILCSCFFLTGRFRVPIGGKRVVLLSQVRQLTLYLLKQVFEPVSRSSFKASASISSCITCRRISSSSEGRESFSIRTREAASSIRSMALSGKNLSAM